MERELSDREDRVTQRLRVGAGRRALGQGPGRRPDPELADQGMGKDAGQPAKARVVRADRKLVAVPVAAADLALVRFPE